MIATAPRTERRAGPLTDKGLVAAACYRLREAWDTLSSAERRELAIALGSLVIRFVRRHPIA
jgi:hypothetical protein